MCIASALLLECTSQLLVTERLLRNDGGVGNTLESVFEPIPVRHLHRKERQAVEHLFEIHFGAKNVRDFFFPWRVWVRFFSARSRDFHRKIFGAGEK
jgi:hypothetical protein